MWSKFGSVEKLEPYSPLYLSFYLSFPLFFSLRHFSELWYQYFFRWNSPVIPLAQKCRGMTTDHVHIWFYLRPAASGTNLRWSKFTPPHCLLIACSLPPHCLLSLRLDKCSYLYVAISISFPVAISISFRGLVWNSGFLRFRGVKQLVCVILLAQSWSGATLRTLGKF